MILTEEKPLVLPVSESWSGCGKRISLEHLTDWDGVEYVEFAGDSIRVDIQDTAVTVSMGDTLPEAGTYRLTVEYSYGDIPFAQSQITFFVNYSGETRGL